MPRPKYTVDDLNAAIEQAQDVLYAASSQGLVRAEVPFGDRGTLVFCKSGKHHEMRVVNGDQNDRLMQANLSTRIAAVPFVPRLWDALKVASEVRLDMVDAATVRLEEWVREVTVGGG